jgi:hypothetical protein
MGSAIRTAITSAAAVLIASVSTASAAVDFVDCICRAVTREEGDDFHLGN